MLERFSQIRSASKYLLTNKLTQTLNAPIQFPPTHEIFLAREHVVTVIERIVARVRPRLG